MNSGLYAAYLGMRARQQRLDLVANNIANASTAGFKADRLLYRSIEAAENGAKQAEANTTGTTPVPAGANPATATATAPAVDPQAARLSTTRNGREVGVMTTETTDFSPGPIRDTGRSLDIALDGDGFIAVQTPRGERYTRQGSLTMDNAGQLVTQSGQLVIGDGGPITVPPGEVTIGSDGTISVGGRSAGQLKIVHFANVNAALAKEGNSLFVATGREKPTEATGTRVVQGALEMSNVNSLTEMVAMMQNTREFESLQKSLSTMMNDLGRKVANEIGKL